MRRVEEPLKQNFVHLAPKALLSVHHHDGYAGVVLLPQLGTRIDVNLLRGEAVAKQNRLRFLTEMAAAASKQEDLAGHLPRLLPIGRTDYC